MFIAVGIVFAIIAIITGETKEKVIEELERPPIGSGKTEYELELVCDGKESSIEILIDERKLNFSEAKELFDRGYEELIKVMAEKNGSLEKIVKDVYLPESILEEGLSVVWSSSNKDYISDFGELDREACVNIDEEGVIVIMTAQISIQDYSAEYEIPILLSRDIYTEEERNLILIEEAIGHINHNMKESNKVELPTQVEGKNIAFYSRKESVWWKFIVFGVMLALVYLLLQKRKEINERADREKELQLEFASLITKLTLMLGAGSGIKNAWEKIVRDYKKSNKKNVAYEEMLKVYNEMQNGLSEGQAYIMFGKRCQLSQYVKLGNLLEQNLRKGTKGLTERLEYEVWEAFEERKALAYRLGEEAGTKLLIPMMLSLGIVITFCVVPAFFSI